MRSLIMWQTILCGLGNLAMLVLAHPAESQIQSRATLSGTTDVYFGDNTGNPQHLASGILLGIPEAPNQIPDHWLSDIESKDQRAGGSQLGVGARGWTHGKEEFMGRYKSLKTAYEVTRRHGGRFQIMIHDMWGIDSWPSKDETPMPGDNGSYADFDKFLDFFFAQLKADGIVENVWWDLWNEVDNVNFLNRGLNRWLEYWGHAHHKIVSEFPNGKTTGPSYGHLPNFAGDVVPYFFEWARFIKQNNSIPDQISLHFLYPNGDLNTSINSFCSYLKAAGIDYKGIWNVQEYGSPKQQVPSGTAWNFAQLERHNAPGLRANWLGGKELHDYLAYLLGKASTGSNYNVSNTNYWPAREYPVYLYYAQQMTGHRVRTEMSKDTLVDSYATVDTDARRVRVLTGCRPNTGTYTLKVHELTSLGLPASGTLSVKSIRFFSRPGRFDRAADPVDQGSFNVIYSGDTASIAVHQNEPDDTFAFEFSY